MSLASLQYPLLIYWLFQHILVTPKGLEECTHTDAEVASDRGSIRTWLIPKKSCRKSCWRICCSELLCSKNFNPQRFKPAWPWGSTLHGHGRSPTTKLRCRDLSGCCKNPVSFAIPRNHVIVLSTLIVFSGESIFGGRSQVKRCPLVVYMVLLQDPLALPVPRRTPSLVVKTWQQQRSDKDS